MNTDNGSFAPLNQETNWGFEISPGPATGNLTLAILVPTNDGAAFSPLLADNGIPAAVPSTTATLLNAGDGSSLSLFLQNQGLLGTGTYSPTDSFTNASAGEATENPGFSGQFKVFTVSFNGVNLQAQGSTTIQNDFSFGNLAPAGTVVVGFFAETSGPQAGNFVGTAASEDLAVTPFADAVPGPVVGAGLPGMLAALFVMIGLNRARRTRNGLITSA